MHRTRKRVVTGVDDRGRSIIVSSGPAPDVREIGGATSEDHWIIEGMPPDLDGTPDAPDRGDFVLLPPPGGVALRLVTFRPGPGEMHATDTIDLGVVISGEIYLVMEEGEVLLKQGDTFIQRGTIHAWDNRSEQDCVLAGVLISSSAPEYSAALG